MYRNWASVSPKRLSFQDKSEPRLLQDVSGILNVVTELQLEKNTSVGQTQPQRAFGPREASL